jgi:hypothetical protein
MFDFQIAGKNSELVLKSFNTINKQSLSSFLFSWDDINPTSASMQARSAI